MAEFSFDVVSEFDSVELTNTLDQARREVGTRYDFKDTATIYDQSDQTILIESASEDRAKAALERAKSHSSQAIQIDPALLEQFGREASLFRTLALAHDDEIEAGDNHDVLT